MALGARGCARVRMASWAKPVWSVSVAMGDWVKGICEMPFGVAAAMPCQRRLPEICIGIRVSGVAEVLRRVRVAWDSRRDSEGMRWRSRSVEVMRRELRSWLVMGLWVTVSGVGWVWGWVGGGVCARSTLAAKSAATMGHRRKWRNLVCFMIRVPYGV